MDAEEEDRVYTVHGGSSGLGGLFLINTKEYGSILCDKLCLRLYFTELVEKYLNKSQEMEDIFSGEIAKASNHYNFNS